jgi:hypothetical protein
MIWYDIYLTAIGLTPGGSSTAQIYTQTHTQNTENGWVKEYAAAVGLYSRYTDQQSVGHLAVKVCFKTSKIIISNCLNHQSDYSID